MHDTLEQSQIIFGVHAITEKKVAIKVIAKPDPNSDPFALVPELQLRYHRLPSRCDGLVKLIEYLDDENFIYQICAYMNSRTLNDLMQKTSVEYIPETDILHYQKSLLNALQSIHRAGFLHNDIQPHNVLLNRDRKGTYCVALNGLSGCRLASSSAQDSDEEDLPHLEN